MDVHNSTFGPIPKGGSMGKSTFLAILIFVALVLAGVCIVKYNGLGGYDEKVTDAWTPLGGQLKKRYASVPRLMPEVHIYVGHEFPEAKALDQTVKEFNTATTFDEQVEAANDTEEGIQKLGQVLGERYPGIISQHQFQVLAELMKGTGDAMSAPIKRYNLASREYNSYARSFPANVVALIFGFPGSFFF